MQRWPAWIYDQGDEPDYRFTFANERTFLAWIRTALALLAAGVALNVVNDEFDSTIYEWLSLLFVALGLLCVVVAWWRWALSERSMRLRAPLPGHRSIAIIVGVLLVAIVALLVAEAQ